MLREDFTRRTMGGLIAVERDFIRQAPVDRDRPTEKRLGGGHISLRTQQEIDGLPGVVDSPVKIGPATLDLDVSLVEAPRSADGASKAAPPLLKFWNIALNPAHDRRVSQRQPAFRDHFHKVSVAELVSQIPAYAENDDVPIEMPAFEKIIDAQHPRSPWPRKRPYPQLCRARGVCTRAVKAAEEALGPLTLAVNCAGIANARPAEEMPVDQWRKMIDVNLTGVFLSCQAEGRVMLPRGRGAIVNIASMSGTIVNRGLTQAHYNASKAGVIHLSKSLAMEWVARGLRVNVISPGYTLTPMNLRPEVAEQRKIFEQETPIGRMATVAEMVGPTIFLLSSTSSFVTGVDLLVDGGFECW
jgi:NAD(P)-dependent dehydrogenase (short-subunit alcohol dehydrogenase family)